jgi:hypothetical protein
MHLFQRAISCSRLRWRAPIRNVACGARGVVPAVLHPCRSGRSCAGRARLFRDGDLFIHATHMNEAAWQLIKTPAGAPRCPPLEWPWPTAPVRMHSTMACARASARTTPRPWLKTCSVMRSAFSFQRLNILQRRMRNEQNVRRF